MDETRSRCKACDYMRTCIERDYNCAVPSADPLRDALKQILWILDGDVFQWHKCREIARKALKQEQKQ